MAIKNAALIAYVGIWDTLNQVWKTGATGVALFKVIDGTASACNNAEAEVDTTNLPGIWKVSLDADEVNGNSIFVGGTTTSTNCVVLPMGFTTDQGELATIKGHVDSVEGTLATIAADVDNVEEQTDTLESGQTSILNAITALNDLSSADVTAAVPTVGQIADQVWDEAISGHLSAGTTGKKLSDLANNSLSAAEVADAVWDEIISGTDHAIDGSAGRRLRTAHDLIRQNDSFDNGTAQAGDTETITLKVGAPAFDLAGKIVYIRTGTGTGQVRVITEYDTDTKVATVHRDWSIEPDNTSVYEVLEGQNANIIQDIVNNFFGTGPGSEPWTVIVKDQGGNIIPEAKVWITYTPTPTDLASGFLLTDDAAKVTFLVDLDVTYYLWAEKNGQNPVRAQAVTPVEV